VAAIAATGSSWSRFICRCLKQRATVLA